MRHDTSHTERIARTTFLNIWIVIGVIIIGGVGISQVQVSRLLRRTLKKIQEKIDPEGIMTG